MKKKLALFAAAAFTLAMTPGVRADVFNDTIGDLNDGVTFGGDVLSNHLHLDITSVEVTNTFSDLIFKINVAGNPTTTDWGKYCMGFDTNPATGDFNEYGNAWGRHIQMTSGMDFWVGTWVDGAMGSQLHWYDGAAWNNIGGTTISKTTSNVTISVALAKLNKSYGDTIDFDVYTTGGGGGDNAIDALANPAVSVTNWAQAYSSGLKKTYTIVTPPLPATNYFKVTVNMEIPIWEKDNAIADGFDTNTDSLYMQGSFNGWTDAPGYKLFQVGDSTLFTNTVQIVQNIGQSVSFKFHGSTFPGYETPVLNCGNNRTLTITTANQTNTLPTYYFGDRKLSDPTSQLTFEVDVDVVRRFGQFDPGLGHGITMPGNFNNWNSGALVLTPGTAPNTNIYSTTLTYNHYPIGACNVGFYKFFISGNAGARDGGWENPISTAAGNRSFSINSVAQTNHYYYNDENPVFNITSIQKLDADKTKITWQSFPSRNNIPVGGQYAILSRDSVTDAWVTNGTFNSTAGSSTFTNTGTTGIPNRFHRVSLIGL